MDLVRYAETCGHEFDFPLENPHEYRDYLIRAFNSDVPYDKFLTEHKRLMENPRLHPEKFNESIIGTGFGIFMRLFMHQLILKWTMQTVWKINSMFLVKHSLSHYRVCKVSHHKFDAISENDYYSLAAYIQGSTRQEYPLDVRGEEKGC